MNYDAIILLSFGGPEGMDDVMPFLNNVLRGKNVPEARKLEVAEHYKHFGGISPINQQNRDLLAALRVELDTHGIDLPLYWGNRNWHPMLEDTVVEMRDDGIKHALALVTSAYSCYSGCRQYKEDIAKVRAAVADAPIIDKIRLFYNHPGFIEANLDTLKAALAKLPGKEAPFVAYTAHSIPDSMASTSQYVRQLNEMADLLSEQTGVKNYKLVYQSRSGPPKQPWLEPDICDFVDELKEQGINELVIAPIGFVSDHLEVLYDLDDEAQEACDKAAITMVRAATAGIHPAMVRMCRELIEERISDGEVKTEGVSPAWGNQCPEGCCAYTAGRPRP